MRNMYAGLLACAALCACAQAEPPPKMGAMPPAQRQAPMPVIDDAEPDVTRQVGALLERVSRGMSAQDQLTDNARAALGAPAMAAISAALKPCGSAPALQLLRRTTKGEDRQYLYRVPCAGKALLVEIDFNKGGKINRLVVAPEPG